ncbi:hypothetical protein [Haloferula sargassicola]|uniref:Uncharacterized protein n=1 Tax=Haloferula sargassicola TaxID=490096 RepID=A0ABP9UQ84_9BACT
MMGYTIAIIAAIVVLLMIAGLCLVGGTRRSGIEGQKPGANGNHGLTREEPHNEGATMPLARESREKA